MVMVMVAVLAGIAIPRMGGSTGRYRLDRAAWRVAADMAYAQTLARRSSQVQPVRFDVVAESYVLPGVPGLDGHAGDYTVGLSGGGDDADLASVRFENSNGDVSTSGFAFDMWGTPQGGDPGSGVPWAPLVSGSIQIQKGKEGRTIAIDPVTGRADVQ
ncbi:MAG: hypothetical protein KBE04_12070 [Phycisphaerae bacterium]|nr:hypothetical protein [Phycisphaerae bacterium]